MNVSTKVPFCMYANSGSFCWQSDCNCFQEAPLKMHRRVLLCDLSANYIWLQISWPGGSWNTQIQAKWYPSGCPHSCPPTGNDKQHKTARRKTTPNVIFLVQSIMAKSAHFPYTQVNVHLKVKIPFSFGHLLLSYRAVVLDRGHLRTLENKHLHYN